MAFLFSLLSMRSMAHSFFFMHGVCDAWCMLLRLVSYGDLRVSKQAAYWNLSLKQIGQCAILHLYINEYKTLWSECIVDMTLSLFSGKSPIMMCNIYSTALHVHFFPEYITFYSLNSKLKQGTRLVVGVVGWLLCVARGIWAGCLHFSLSPSLSRALHLHLVCLSLYILFLLHICLSI